MENFSCAKGTRVLITGGAGFVGSHLVNALLNAGACVTVLDNFSTGFFKNIEEFATDNNFILLEGDIRDTSICDFACKGIDFVVHQAALGSVPRSINDPLTTNEVNVTGFINILEAARKAKVKRIVYAASSSTYGDSQLLPKKEENIGKPLSPYAVTKLVNELYADVFGKVYGMELIGLRYFNVFGPRQNPDGPYAAVIPLFIRAALNQKPPLIHGDGLQTRDFTYIDNVVQANMKALFTTSKEATNQVYNVACGERYSLIGLWRSIQDVMQIDLEPTFVAARAGDVRDSLADISKGENLLNYKPAVRIKEGLVRTIQWYQENKTVLV